MKDAAALDHIVSGATFHDTLPAFPCLFRMAVSSAFTYTKNQYITAIKQLGLGEERWFSINEFHARQK